MSGGHFLRGAALLTVEADFFNKLKYQNVMVKYALPLGI